MIREFSFGVEYPFNKRKKHSLKELHYTFNFLTIFCSLEFWSNFSLSNVPVKVLPESPSRFRESSRDFSHRGGQRRESERSYRRSDSLQHKGMLMKDTYLWMKYLHYWKQILILWTVAFVEPIIFFSIINPTK